MVDGGWTNDGIQKDKQLKNCCMEIELQPKTLYDMRHPLSEQTRNKLIH